MERKFVYAVVSLDHALIWKDSLDSGTKPMRIEASEDNPQYRKQHNSNVGHRDRSTMNSEFAERLFNELKDAGYIYLVSAGTGKANSANQFVDYLEEKHPELAHNILGTGTADVNSLSNNQLLELGRDRKARHLQMG